MNDFLRTAPTPPRLSASEHTIDVWLAFYDEIADEALMSAMRGLLSDAERRQEPRFYFPDDRKRYVVTRAMVRTVLSRYADIAPHEWAFSTNDYGRPDIANDLGQAHGLSFNVSHTRGLIALGVTRNRALGVDVEHILHRDVSLGIAHRFFSPVEVTELAAVPPDLQQDRFFEYWTFKESYIKARGMGLSIPLERFSFHYPRPQAVHIAIEPELGDVAERWSFWQYRPAREYLLAVCAERLQDQATTLTLRKMVPTHSDETLDFQLLKSSEPRV